ncbi:MAG: hypothetical protein Q9222_002499 [Ikaeria aurantiellina]
MKPTPCGEENRNTAPPEAPFNGHGTYAFYFVRANLYGWVRIVMKIASVVALVNYLCTCTSRDLTEVLQNMRLRQTREDFVRSTEKLKPVINLAVNTSISKSNRASDATAANARSGPLVVQAIDGTPGSVSPQVSGSVQQHQQGPPGADDQSLHSGNSSRSMAISTEISKAHPDVEACASSKVTGQVPTMAETMHADRPDVLVKVNQAGSYLDSIFLTNEQYVETKPERNAAGSSGPRKKSCLPNTLWSKTSPVVLWLRYLGCCLRIIWDNNPPADLRWRISFHMTASGRYPYSRALEFLHRMRQVNKVGEPPDWRILAIASDIQLSQIPLTVTSDVWMWQAVQKLIVFMLLIIQVELTIVWNHVTGLKTLSSLGQLIPFILGVGGLLKVVWAKWCLVQKGIGEDVDANLRHHTEYELAMMKYIEWAEAIEKTTKAHTVDAQEGPSTNILPSEQNGIQPLPEAHV